MINKAPMLRRGGFFCAGGEDFSGVDAKQILLPYSPKFTN
jgi:hypothetical protein